MSDPDSNAYYLRRERQERALAESARDPAASAIHLTLADRYSKLIDQGEARPVLRLRIGM